MRTGGLAVSLLLLLAASPAWAQAEAFEVIVEAGPHDRVNTPVRVLVYVPLAVSDKLKTASVIGEGMQLTGQLTLPGLHTPLLPPKGGMAVRELHFILPRLAAGQTATFKVTGAPAVPGKNAFSWRDSPEKSELFYDDKPVLIYLARRYDDSSKEKRELSYKVFHHLYDLDGVLVTKGEGGKFPHHRGLFYGFNRVTYGGEKKVDIWHCSGDTHQAHAATLSLEAGPVLARQRVEIAWNGVGKETFAVEQRELTVYRVPGGQLIEFASRLRGADGEVKVDGDPQHAGFHFRAANEVAESTAKQTYFLRPTGKGQPGTERNWPKDAEQVNLPWLAMSFVLAEKRYTAVYLDRPQNPKEARFSERTYGRFGSYFAAAFDQEKPLDVRYRLWLQAGEVEPKQANHLSADFTSPPKVIMK